MTSNQKKAYGLYMEKHNLKPTLCTYPTLYFIDKDGKTIKRTMDQVYIDLGWVLSVSSGKFGPARSKAKAKKEAAA